MLGVDGVRAYMTDYAKRAVLGSSAVVGMVGRFVESVACTILESIVVGSVSYVLKEVISPWAWTDVVVVDIGLNVVYILCAMDHVRAHFHYLFKKPCRRLARKILGLDIRDPWAFLKLKYTIMVAVMATIMVAMYCIQNIVVFVVLLFSETLVVHVLVDTWHMRGDRIRFLVSDQLGRLGPKPSVRVFRSMEDLPGYVDVHRTASGTSSSSSSSSSSSLTTTTTQELGRTHVPKSEHTTETQNITRSGEHGNACTAPILNDHFSVLLRRARNTKQ